MLGSNLNCPHGAWGKLLDLFFLDLSFLIRKMGLVQLPAPQVTRASAWHRVCWANWSRGISSQSDRDWSLGDRVCQGTSSAAGLVSDFLWALACPCFPYL